MKFVVLLATAAAIGSCASCGNGFDDPAPVVVPAEGKELCSQACDAMNEKLVNSIGEVGCEEGTPIPAPPDILSCQGSDCPELVTCSGSDAGTSECVTCVWFCEYGHEQGSYWNTSCITNDITSCSEIESICNIQ